MLVLEKMVEIKGNREVNVHLPKPVELDPCGRCNSTGLALPCIDKDKLYWKCSRCGKEI